MAGKIVNFWVSYLNTIFTILYFLPCQHNHCQNNRPGTLLRNSTKRGKILVCMRGSLSTYYTGNRIGRNASKLGARYREFLRSLKVKYCDIKKYSWWSLLQYCISLSVFSVFLFPPELCSHCLENCPFTLI